MGEGGEGGWEGGREGERGSMGERVEVEREEQDGARESKRERKERWKYTVELTGEKQGTKNSFFLSSTIVENVEGYSVVRAPPNGFPSWTGGSVILSGCVTSAITCSRGTTEFPCYIHR